MRETSFPPQNSPWSRGRVEVSRTVRRTSPQRQVERARPEESRRLEFTAGPQAGQSPLGSEVVDACASATHCVATGLNAVIIHLIPLHVYIRARILPRKFRPSNA